MSSLGRFRQSCRVRWGVLAAVVICLLQGAGVAGDHGLALDLRQPRSELRATLLKFTPLGTPAATVLSFLTKHFGGNGTGPIALIDRPAPLRGKRATLGSKFIRVYLGQYYAHPELVFLTAPVIAQREVTAYWIFDQNARLIEVDVDKRTGIY
jgi:hypothetical protein